MALLRATSGAKCVLITGGSGQLGTALQRSWPSDWHLVSPGREAFDLTDIRGIRNKIAAGHNGNQYAAVINCAAYTEVDKAEAERHTPWIVNAEAPAALAEACASHDVPVLHISTDYVFSGRKAGAWRVDDPVSPLNVYGASKLAGEDAVRASDARYVIVRTSWLFSPYGRNFVTAMLERARRSDTVSVVADQYGCPTSAADLAQALVHLTRALIDDGTTQSGTIHFSNRGRTSWANFAETLFHQSAERGGPSAAVHRMLSQDYATIAQRPENSELDCSIIENRFGITPRPWQEALAKVIDVLLAEVRI